MNAAAPEQKMLGPLPAPHWHRPWFRYVDPVDGGEGGKGDGGDGGGKQDDGDAKGERTFTQDDVDRIVNTRLAQAKRQFDEQLRQAKAEAGQTVEQQLAELRAKYAEAEARALRSDIAARFGISAEDRDLFLTGTDKATLEAQAKRLQERDAERQKKGPVARREGDTKRNAAEDEELREFTRDLFARAAADA